MTLAPVAPQSLAATHQALRQSRLIKSIVAVAALALSFLATLYFCPILALPVMGVVGLPTLAYFAF